MTAQLNCLIVVATRTSPAISGPADCGTSPGGDNDKAIQLGGHTGGNLAVFIGGGSGWAVWQHTKSALRWYNVDLRWRRCDSLRAQCRRFDACAFLSCSISVLFFVKSTIASVSLVTAILPTSRPACRQDSGHQTYTRNSALYEKQHRYGARQKSTGIKATTLGT